MVLRNFSCAAGANLNVKPETDHSAQQRDAPKRKGTRGNAYTIRAQRDQFVVCGEPSEHEQDRRQQAPGNRKDE